MSSKLPPGIPPTLRVPWSVLGTDLRGCSDRTGLVDEYVEFFTAPPFTGDLRAPLIVLDLSAWPDQSRNCIQNWFQEAFNRKRLSEHQ
jgi:hypothetical protein